MREVEPPGLAEPSEQPFEQLLPDTGLLSNAQGTPAGHAGTEAEADLSRESLSGDPGREHEQDSVAPSRSASEASESANAISSGYGVVPYSRRSVAHRWPSNTRIASSRKPGDASMFVNSPANDQSEGTWKT